MAALAHCVLCRKAKQESRMGYSSILGGYVCFACTNEHHKRGGS